MNNQPKPKPRFWPVVFITAFALGGVLWCLWMAKVIRQTREIRDRRDPGFVVPMSTNAPAAKTNAINRHRTLEKSSFSSAGGETARKRG